VREKQQTKNPNGVLEFISKTISTTPFSSGVLFFRRPPHPHSDSHTNICSWRLHHHSLAVVVVVVFVAHHPLRAAIPVVLVVAATTTALLLVVELLILAAAPGLVGARDGPVVILVDGLGPAPPHHVLVGTAVVVVVVAPMMIFIVCSARRDEQICRSCFSLFRIGQG
jgi:hypothetical protein